MNLSKKLKALAVGAMVCFGASSASAAVISFAGGNDGSTDGVSLSCAVTGSATCAITLNNQGLGVTWSRASGATDGQPGQVDSNGPDETITISFAQDMVWNNVMLGRWDRSDDFSWAADGASGFYSASSPVFELGGYVSSFLSISARGAGDRFTIKSIDVAPVPLPAAGWMLLAGVGGLALMRRRAKA